MCGPGCNDSFFFECAKDLKENFFLHTGALLGNEVKKIMTNENIKILSNVLIPVKIIHGEETTTIGSYREREIFCKYDAVLLAFS